MWRSTTKSILRLLLFGVCLFPPAQNNKLGPSSESPKWGIELNWKTIMATQSSLALWCVFSWSVKLSGEGKENHHSAGLQPAPIAKTNLGGRQSWLLRMGKTVISHLFVGMAAMYKQLWSHSGARNALYSTFFSTIGLKEVAMAPTEHSNTSLRSQKGGQGRQR